MTFVDDEQSAEVEDAHDVGPGLGEGRAFGVEEGLIATAYTMEQDLYAGRLRNLRAQRSGTPAARNTPVAW